MQPEKQQTREQFVKSLFVLEEKDNYLLGDEAIKKLCVGIQKGVDVISKCYGTSGINAEVEHYYQPFHMTTNDGKIILDNIYLSDRYENMGFEILKEITSRVEKESGNGRKTAVILAGAILREALEVKKTVSVMDIKKSLEESLEIVLESLDKQSKKIAIKDISKVATIASENEMLGKTFQEIYSIIGKDGAVEIDNSGLPETFYEIVDGVRLQHCGFTYPYMANSDKGRSAVYLKPDVLIVKEKITNIHQLDGVYAMLTAEGKSELVIFCDEIDLTVSQQIAMLDQGMQRKDGSLFVFKTLVIKAPTLWKDWMFEDFAKITGATIIDPGQGTSLKSFQTQMAASVRKNARGWIGTCDKITTTGVAGNQNAETIVTGIKDISDHIKVLLEDANEQFKLRASWLQTKTAILKLGANSDSELSYLRGKASDARNSSYFALNGGIVAGGGIAYLNAVAVLPETVGGKILKEALKVPFKTIVENAGKKCDIEMVGGKDGFDSKKGKIVDMYEEGILDTTIVVKNSLIYAISVISTVLTTRLSILLSDKNKKLQ